MPAPGFFIDTNGLTRMLSDQGGSTSKGFGTTMFRRLQNV